jgi:hypothetical protein
MQDAGICAGPEVCADPALMGWVGSANGNVDQPRTMRQWLGQAAQAWLR